MSKPADVPMLQALAATMSPPCGREDEAAAVMRGIFPGWGSRCAAHLSLAAFQTVVLHRITTVASCMLQGWR